jgi:heme-degrading monooxygenase HmoA
MSEDKTRRDFLTEAGLGIFVLIGAGCRSPNTPPAASDTEKGVNAMSTESLKKAKVARIWQGRVPDAKADEYEGYLHAEGLNKLAAIAGNLGVQMMRFARDGATEFIVISYWENREDIKKYAGENIEKPHHLPKDKDYLLELPEFVKNCDLKVNDWK